MLWELMRIKKEPTRNFKRPHNPQSNMTVMCRGLNAYFSKVPSASNEDVVVVVVVVQVNVQYIASRAKPIAGPFAIKGPMDPELAIIRQC